MTDLSHFFQDKRLLFNYYFIRAFKTLISHCLKGTNGNRHLNSERNTACFGPVFRVSHVQFIVYFIFFLISRFLAIFVIF